MSGQRTEPLVLGVDVSHGDHWVVVRWKQRGPESREVIVVKSEERHADDLGELFADDPVQRAIYFDTGEQCQDQDLVPGVKYYYTVFAQAPDGTWHTQGRGHAKAPQGAARATMSKFHDEGTILAKLDTLRIGILSGGGYGVGGT